VNLQGQHLYSVKKLVSLIDDYFYFGTHWIKQEASFFIIFICFIRGVQYDEVRFQSSFRRGLAVFV